MVDYDLDITYHLGKANMVTNALSRRRSKVVVGEDVDMLVNIYDRSIAS